MVRFNFEYTSAEKVHAGYIGCGEHSYRNVYPAFQYAPVELVACCDLHESRAQEYARIFGARCATGSVQELLEMEEIKAVFIVTGFDENGHPLATDLALQALRAGKHVWMEKPPAADVAGVERLMAASHEAGKTVMVGFKKMFSPAIEKVKSVLGTAEFGLATSASLRYPLSLPADPSDGRAMSGFLDLAHPASILQYLFGPVERLFFERAENGGVAATLRFVSGPVAALHLTAGHSGMSPLERLEVIGQGANIVVKNGVRVIYYRRGNRGAYGRSENYITSDEEAPLVWEPEFSLGVLNNKSLFLQGFVSEVLYFCECVLAGRTPIRGGLEDALAMMKLYEGFRHPPGTSITIHPAPHTPPAGEQ